MTAPGTESPLILSEPKVDQRKMRRDSDKTPERRGHERRLRLGRRTNERQRVSVLLVLMAGLATATAAISIGVLYRAAISEREHLLVELVQRQAAAIRAGAAFENNRQAVTESVEPRLDRIFRTQRTDKGFGETGEFLLGRRTGDQIIYLLPFRFRRKGGETSAPFDAEPAEPMRRALQGQSGTMTGLDYRGARVVAAFEPLFEELNSGAIGIVAKVDVAEIRAPFVNAGLIGGAGALILIVFGVPLFRRVSSPLVERLETSVASLENAQRIAHIGSWDRDLRTGNIIWSDETFRIYGLKPDGVKPSLETFINCIHPDDRETVQTGMDDAISGDGVLSLDFRIVALDQPDRFVHTEGVTTTDETGAPIRFSGTVQDITDRKRAEAALRNSEEKSRALIDNSSQGILVHRNLSPLHANRALLDLFGYESLDELLALESTAVLFAPEERARHNQYHAARLRGDDAPPNYDTKGLRKNGAEIWLNNRPYRIRWDDDWAVCSNLFDITAARSLRSQVTQVSKLAALGEMTTGVAHELSQPLNIIQMAAESSLESMEGGSYSLDMVKDKLARIVAQTERAGAIVDHMRTFGDVSFGNTETVDILDVTARAVAMVKESFRLKGITVSTVFPDKCQNILGNRSNLEQVVSNILVNARDAIFESRKIRDELTEGRITVRVEDNVDSGMVTLAITDTGAGIPGEVIDRIFEPFFSTKEIGKGVGMGLATSYGIVRDMGGTIKAANGEDGAIISVILPGLTEGVK